MRNFIFATAAILFTSSAAFAAPFSAQISGDSEATVAGFKTFAQCQAYISGQSGTCIDNGQDWTNAQARYALPRGISAPVVIETNPQQP